MNDTTINCSNIRELPKPCCIDWLVREDSVSIDDADVKCFRIEGSVDENALQKWALHIRRHYLRDDELKSYVEFFVKIKSQMFRRSEVETLPRYSLATSFSSSKVMRFLDISNMVGKIRTAQDMGLMSLPTSSTTSKSL